MGTSALSNPRAPLGGAGRRRRAQGAHRGARRAPLASSDHRRVDRFSFKTLERWWYIARGADDPLAALARRVPSHAGTHPSLNPALAEAIARQHHDHPRWTFQLHHDTRVQRRSDGTLTVEGVRFEVPSAYRTLLQLRLRVARWDLSSVDLVDPRSGDHLATLLPLDKARNAERVRRVVPSIATDQAPPPVGIAPHLRALMADYAATGLPPAYLPKHDSTDDPPEDS
jgi:hypothetical protein